jgi:acetylornithine/N-succinyldiaminopimelate aminotransferase
VTEIPTDTAPQTPTQAQAELGLFAPLYPLPRLELTHGRGSWVFDADEREYLDFTSGIAVNALGHAPRGLAQHVNRQMRRLVHCSNYFANRPAIELAQLLTEATGYPRVFFCNSGSEGVEAALKFARFRANLKGMPGQEVVAFQGGFHGRTAFALSATWKAAYREPFEPLVDGIRFAPFNDREAVEKIPWDQVAAVLVEPVQGENGAVPATAEFLHALRDRAAASGAALILDEVQCGLGRCGSFLASEPYGVRADFVVLSKALAGGLPMGAVLMSQEAGQALAPGLHGCTFGGGPVVASAGGFVVRRLLEPGFLDRVRQRGEELESALAMLVERRASLMESRGLGLLRAVELSAKAGTRAEDLLAACRRHGLLLVPSGAEAVRFLPPLTVSTLEIHMAIERFEAALLEAESMGGKEA